MSDHTPRLSSDQDYWDCLSIYHTAVMAIPLIDLGPDRREAFLGLAKKIYFHAASIHTLSKGTAGPEYNFVDHQSISALVRTFVESYAQLNHVFLTEPFNSDGFEFRFLYYKYRGLYWHHITSESLPISEDEKRQEAGTISDLLDQISATAVYQNLTKAHQRKVRDANYDRPKEIVGNALASLPIMTIARIYGFLSDTVHGGYFSAKATYVADTYAAQQDLSDRMLYSVENILGLAALRCFARFPHVFTAPSGEQFAAKVLDIFERLKPKVEV